MAERNPLFANLKDFKPKPADAEQEPKIDPKVVDEIAQANDFHSRVAPEPEKSAAPRRRRNITGRNQQINIKTTSTAIDDLYAIADRKRVTLGEVFERALEELKKTQWATTDSN